MDAHGGCWVLRTIDRHYGHIYSGDNYQDEEEQLEAFLNCFEVCIKEKIGVMGIVSNKEMPYSQCRKMLVQLAATCPFMSLYWKYKPFGFIFIDANKRMNEFEISQSVPLPTSDIGVVSDVLRDFYTQHLQAQAQQTNERYQQVSKRLNSVENKLTNMNKQVQASQSQYYQEMKEHNQEIKEHKLETQRLNATIESLSRKLDADFKEKEDIKNRIAQVSKKENKLKEKERRINAQQNKLDDERKKMDDEREKMMEQQMRINVQQSKMDDQRKRIHERERRAKETEQKLRQRQTQWEIVVEKKENQIQCRREMLEEASQKFQQLSGNNQQMFIWLARGFGGMCAIVVLLIFYILYWNR